MKTVKEISQLTGVSVRTLHHYDAIGLLRPSQISPAGYRLYDEDALQRLRKILVYRELAYPWRPLAIYWTLRKPPGSKLYRIRSS